MDIDQALKALERFLPHPVISVIIVVLAAIALATAAKPALKVLMSAVGYLRLRVGGGAAVDAARLRKNFCLSMIRKLEQINEDERWSDRSYIDLEAEVEADGSRGGLLGYFLRFAVGGDQTRKERSLSRAIRTSRDDFIKLVGDPGSGKSVALRHVALKMAARAQRSAKRKSRPIGLYVSLKDFRPPSGRDITSEDIRDHIFSFYKRLDEVRQVKYLRENFQEGVERGAWFFLFDSFDEIPAVLAATEVTPTVSTYEKALSDFLIGAAPCRGLVASRQYRGPAGLSWPTFRIAPLTDQRRRALVQRAQIATASRKLILAELPNAGSNIRELADNAMFLGLICEFTQNEGQFPPNAHAVFESYVEQTLPSTDEISFEITRRRARLVAEQIAYCMSAAKGLGLSVSVDELEAEAERQSLSGVTEIRATVEVLREARLARAEHVATALSGPPFSFAHRRFQEYFATCFVLNDTSRVSVDELLMSGRWRETAVTVLQMHPFERTAVLRSRASELLAQATADLPEIGWQLAGEAEGAESAAAPPRKSTYRFGWGDGVLHLLSLLDAGMASKTKQVDPGVEAVSARILSNADANGILPDRRWALEVAGTTPPALMAVMVRNSFRSGSAFLREAAFRQIGRLHPLPPDIRREITTGLLTFSANGELRRRRLAILSQLSQVEDSGYFVSMLKLLRWLPLTDLALNLLVVLMFLETRPGAVDVSLILALAALSVTSFLLVRLWPSFCWYVDRPYLPRWFVRAVRSAFGQFAGCYVALMVRAALIVLVGQTFPRIPGQVLALVATSLLLSWAFAMLVLVRYYAPRPTVWVWFFPLFFLALRTLRWISTFPLRKTISLLLLVSVAVAFVLAIFVGVGVVVDVTGLGPVMLIVFVTFFALIGCLGVVALAWAVVRRLRDALTTYRLVHEPPTRISDAVLFELMLSYRTSAGLSQLSGILRTHRLISQSADCMTVLTDLSRLHEWSRGRLEVEKFEAGQRAKDLPLFARLRSAKARAEADPLTKDERLAATRDAFLFEVGFESTVLIARADQDWLGLMAWLRKTSGDFWDDGAKILRDHRLESDRGQADLAA